MFENPLQNQETPTLFDHDRLVQPLPGKYEPYLVFPTILQHLLVL
jgi:hypothetical protein